MNNDCIYVVDQRKTYSPYVQKYVFYATAYEASVHGTINSVEPYQRSRTRPPGVQGVDYVIYDQFIQSSE